ncbi:hypothetical protein PRIC2_008856 [Phytophthora ramorum]
MLVLRTSRRAVRLAETLPSPIRSLCAVTRVARRSGNAAALQRLSFDFNSRHVIGFHGSFVGRHFSSSTGEDAGKVEKLQQQSAVSDENQVYRAPMSRAVRLMKAVSVTSCTLTSMGMPVLCLLSEQDASMIGKWAMCGTIMLFGLGTTSLFHYLFKPYVMRMWMVNPSEDDPEVTVETVTLFAQLQHSSFRLSEVAPPTMGMHPMVTFQARDRHYFIHPEAFEDQHLLNKLVGSGNRK